MIRTRIMIPIKITAKTTIKNKRRPKSEAPNVHAEIEATPAV
jgi:hypothetical protein